MSSFIKSKVNILSSNLLWFVGNLSVEDYLKFWKKEYKNLRQVKREEFNKLFDNLENNQIIVPEDRSIIKEKILNKNYDKLNICPGFLLKYSWESQTAITLDKCNKFIEDFNNKVITAFSVIERI